MNRLADLRKRKKMSQAELGKKFGAAQNTVSQWERGTREPDFEMLQSLAEFFGVSTDYLLGRTYVERPNIDLAKAGIIPLPEEEKVIQPTENDNLSEAQRALVQFTETLSDEQAIRALQILKLALGNVQ